MDQIVNEKYSPLFTERPRYFILMGGRGAGRSTVASQFATAKVVSPEYFRCAIMRFILTDVRHSIYQDIIDRAEEQEIIGQLNIREHNLFISYGANRINGLGFRKSSSDQKSKLKSLASYNCVIIEEADEINEEDFMQLDDSLRTLKSDIVIVLLLNPPDKNHWIIKRWFNLIDSGVEGFYKPVLKQSEAHNTIFIWTSYLDNLDNLNASTITNYEHYKDIRPDYYYNMIKGLVSEGKRGRIYKNWQPISVKEYEELPYPESYGLDFGFTNDPTALVGIKTHNNKVWTRELIYETGLTNPRISAKLGQLGIKKTATIWADSAEPKSIEEIKLDGWNIKGAVKGQDSVNVGIDMMLDKEVYYTEDSKNIALENQEYKWALDRNKEPINEPIDKFNHCMDAIRMNVFSESKREFIGVA